MMRKCDNDVGHMIGQPDNSYCDRHHEFSGLPDSPYVQETTKIAEIRDSFGQLRFKVFMIDMLDYYEETPLDERYRITVDSFCYGPSPVTILKDFRKHFSEAYAHYLKCIELYTHLAIAETRNFQDIRIYADKIEYHLIDPQCCKNCKWSIKVHEYDQHCHCHEDHQTAKGTKYMCMNHELFNVAHSKIISDIEPIVDPNGICKHYKDRREHCK